jgi:hypothetical protein
MVSRMWVWRRCRLESRTQLPHEKVQTVHQRTCRCSRTSQMVRISKESRCIFTPVRTAGPQHQCTRSLYMKRPEIPSTRLTILLPFSRVTGRAYPLFDRLNLCKETSCITVKSHEEVGVGCSSSKEVNFVDENLLQRHSPSNHVMCSERWIQNGDFGNGGFGVWVLAIKDNRNVPQAQPEVIRTLLM